MTNKKEKIALVKSNKMQKTVVVEIKERVKHKLFQKYFTVRKKYKAHDEKGECKVGDIVVIRSTKPISREKRWAVVRILEKSV